MGSATGVDIPPRTRGLQSGRLLRLAGDERLVEQIRRGSEAAFEVAFERHAPAILGYCRHMLGSPEEAEDAVQHTFAAAYGDLQRGDEREIALRPWLFAIARNRCVSLLRRRRELAVEEPELVTAGLAEQVERRAELRQLLADVRDLPDEQRDALLLAEVGDLPQADIARVLGCEVSRVKGLVYRARSALIARREARELPCEEVREQLATLRGGSLRRAELRLHLRECPGCRAFRENVRAQRRMLSVALPVAPTLALKSSVLAAVGTGAGGGGAAAAGLFGGGSVAAKLAVAGVLAVGGGTVAVVAEHESGSGDAGNVGQEAPAPDRGGGPPGASFAPIAPSAEGVGRPTGRDRPAKRPTRTGRGEARGRGRAEARARGRGPIDAPPKDTPVRRGPPEGKGKPEQPGKPPQAGGKGRPQGKLNGGPQGKARGPAKGRATPRDKPDKAATPKAEAEPKEPEPAGGVKPQAKARPGPGEPGPKEKPDHVPGG